MRMIAPEVLDVWLGTCGERVVILYDIKELGYPCLVGQFGLSWRPRDSLKHLIERDGKKMPGPGDWCSSKMWGLMTGNELELFNRYDEIIANGDNECAKMEDGLPWLRLDENGELPKAPEKPAEKKTAIQRFEIFRDDRDFGIANKHGGMPYIIARNDKGTPLKYFQDRELIHGYIYDDPNCPDSDIIISTPFLLWDVEQKCIAQFCDDTYVRLGYVVRMLPMAVLVEVEE